MTSQSHSAAVQARSAVQVPRRPSPPRPAAANQTASPASPAPAQPRPAVSGAVTYVPEAYDPGHAPAGTMVSGPAGMVFPSQRSGRAVWVVLFLIVAAVAGFIGWRVVHTGSPAEPGIAYTSTEGHYTVRFPAQPSTLTKTESDRHTKLVIHMAFVPGQGGVFDAQVGGALSPSVDTLAAKLASEMGGTGGITLTGVHKFTFDGARAEQGNFISPTTGELMSVLEVVPSSRRVYIVMGLTGPTFDTLKGSFHVLP
jgi:hypothetical protein